MRLLLITIIITRAIIYFIDRGGKSPLSIPLSMYDYCDSGAQNSIHTHTYILYNRDRNCVKSTTSSRAPIPSYVWKSRCTPVVKVRTILQGALHEIRPRDHSLSYRSCIVVNFRLHNNVIIPLVLLKKYLISRLIFVHRELMEFFADYTILISTIVVVERFNISVVGHIVYVSM